MSLAGINTCLGQWPKTIDCPADRVYRNTRDENGQEFCEHLLAGSLKVKDGLFRFWFSPDFQGSAGSYAEGREIGAWKECDRFGRCEQKQYPANHPEETQRPGYRPEIPVLFINGKYVFDFSSCRSTWVTQTEGGTDVLALNISGFNPSTCEVNYLPMGRDPGESPIRLARRSWGRWI
jgi:hypothetical protein